LPRQEPASVLTPTNRQSSVVTRGRATSRNDTHRRRTDPYLLICAIFLEIEKRIWRFGEICVSSRWRCLGKKFRKFFRRDHGFASSQRYGWHWRNTLGAFENPVRCCSDGRRLGWRSFGTRQHLYSLNGDESARPGVAVSPPEGSPNGDPNRLLTVFRDAKRLLTAFPDEHPKRLLTTFLTLRDAKRLLTPFLLPRSRVGVANPHNAHRIFSCPRVMILQVLLHIPLDIRLPYAVRFAHSPWEERRSCRR